MVVVKGKMKVFSKILMAGLGLGMLGVGYFAPTLIHAEDDFSVVMITSDPTIPGANFIFDGWEGLMTFGRENIMEEGEEGYHLLPVYEAGDHHTHFSTAVEGDYDLIIGLGIEVEDYLEEYATQYTDQQFLMIDGDLDLPNVISVEFKDHEAAFLAGLAAGLETQNDSIGFIGGMDSETIGRFEAGFKAGIEEVNAEAELEVVYLDGFTDHEGAVKAAQAMFDQNVDVVFHAAGLAGMGVFEAAQTYISDSGEAVWVIGVDSDQTEAGEFNHGDTNYSITLTSTLKKVGNVIHDLTQEVYEGQFEAGVYQYGMFEDAIDISAGNLTGETLELVGDYRDQLRAGDFDISRVVKLTE